MRIAMATGILYKFNKYSDRAAIAFAYTKEYGNIKLFVPSIANNNNVLVRHIPGTIHFHHKPNSDLHKLITFHEDLSYAHYLDTPEIYTRLGMIFEVVHYAQMSVVPDITNNRTQSETQNETQGETQGETQENAVSNVVWYLLTRYQEGNAAKLTLYIIFTILGGAGYMFSPWECTECGGDMLPDGSNASGNGRSGSGTALYASLNSRGETLCTRCTPQPHTITASEISSTAVKYIHPAVVMALQCFYSSEMYKGLEVSSVVEHELLDLLFFHTSNTLNHQLHAYKHYKLIMPPIA